MLSQRDRHQKQNKLNKNVSEKQTQQNRIKFRKKTKTLCILQLINHSARN
jgi:hypothetical protein